MPINSDISLDESRKIISTWQTKVLRTVSSSTLKICESLLLPWRLWNHRTQSIPWDKWISRNPNIRIKMTLFFSQGRALKHCSCSSDITISIYVSLRWGEISLNQYKSDINRYQKSTRVEYKVKHTTIVIRWSIQQMHNYLESGNGSWISFPTTNTFDKHHNCM